jgi:hypothetical protein
MEIKVGDLVERINSDYGSFKVGMRGKVIRTDAGGNRKMILVEGHNGTNDRINLKIIRNWRERYGRK